MKRYVVVCVMALGIAAIANAQGTNPPVPVNVNAQSFTGQHPRVLLTWQVPQGPWYSVVYRSVNDTSHFTRVYDCPGNRYEDHGVIGGHAYYYYVKTAMWNDSLVLSTRSAIAGVTPGSSTGVRGTIRGSVRDDSTNIPIRSVRIRFYRQGANWTNIVDVTDTDGFYEMEVDTGRYLLRAEPQWEHNSISYLPEWFDNATDPSNATVVVVGNGTTFSANFGLRRFTPVRRSSITGRVLNQQSEPVAGATVAIMRSIQDMQRLAATTGSTPGLGSEARALPAIGYTRGVLWSGTTGSDGRFRGEVPSNGSYIVAAAKDGYLLQYFDQTADPTEARVILAASDTFGVTFMLGRAATTPNSVQGIVRDSTGDRVPSRVILFPRPPQGRPTIIIHTGSDGAYQINNIESGIYSMLAVPYSNYSLGFYKEGEYGVVSWQQADTIIVGGSSPAINVGVAQIQSIGLTRVSGVSITSNGAQIVGSRIVARNADGNLVGIGVSSTAGFYAIDGLPAGQITFSVDKEPYNPETAVVNIPANTFSVTNINLVMQRTGTTGTPHAGNSPYAFGLEQNYPNPFNPATIIHYEVGASGLVLLRVFDLLGRNVSTLVHEVKEPGRHDVVWDGRDKNGAAVSSGIYYYHLSAGSSHQVRKMILMK